MKRWLLFSSSRLQVLALGASNCNADHTLRIEVTPTYSETSLVDGAGGNAEEQKCAMNQTKQST